MTLFTSQEIFQMLAGYWSDSGNWATFLSSSRCLAQACSHSRDRGFRDKVNIFRASWDRSMEVVHYLHHILSIKANRITKSNIDGGRTFYIQERNCKVMWQRSWKPWKPRGVNNCDYLCNMAQWLAHHKHSVTEDSYFYCGVDYRG